MAHLVITVATAKQAEQLARLLDNADFAYFTEGKTLTISIESDAPPQTWAEGTVAELQDMIGSRLQWKVTR